MKTWWRKGMDVGFGLMRIGYTFRHPTELKGPKMHIEDFPGLYLIGIGDVDQHDCIEEQLWAQVEGMA